MYDDLIANQGSQPDGGTPDPSQQPQDGEPTPAPSQEPGGQEPQPQQAADALPAQDDRGVPAQNVLAEMRRKLDQTMEAVRQMSENFTRYQQPQAGGYQPPIPQQVQAQPQQRMPVTFDEAAEILTKEVQEKISSGEITDQMQLETFRNRRFFELNQQVQNAVLATQNERAVSEQRIKAAYPDLSDMQSPLSRAVINEIVRRSSLPGQKDLYKNNPYCLEGIVPYVASSLGIQPKFNGRRVQPTTPTNLPQNIGGRASSIPPADTYVPTEVELALSPKYGNDPVAMAKFNREHPDPLSITVDDVLLS